MHKIQISSWERRKTIYVPDRATKNKNYFEIINSILAIRCFKVLRLPVIMVVCDGHYEKAGAEMQDGYEKFTILTRTRSSYRYLGFVEFCPVWISFIPGPDVLSVTQGCAYVVVSKRSALTSLSAHSSLAECKRDCLPDYKNYCLSPLSQIFLLIG